MCLMTNAHSLPLQPQTQHFQLTHGSKALTANVCARKENLVGSVVRGVWNIDWDMSRKSFTYAGVSSVVNGSQFVISNGGWRFMCCVGEKASFVFGQIWHSPTSSEALKPSCFPEDRQLRSKTFSTQTGQTSWLLWKLLLFRPWQALILMEMYFS